MRSPSIMSPAVATLLAVVLITGAIILFVLPTEFCGGRAADDEESGSSAARPADIMLALDASGSIHTDEWRQVLDNVRSIDQIRDGTYLAPPLLECIAQFDRARNVEDDQQHDENQYRLCIVISDGINQDFGIIENSYCESHPDLKGDRCTVLNIATHMKTERGIAIMGIFVCSGLENCRMHVVQGISSCPPGNTDGCLFFQHVQDFDALEEGAEELAISLSRVINNNGKQHKDVCLKNPLYLLILLLLMLPLLACLATGANRRCHHRGGLQKHRALNEHDGVLAEHAAVALAEGGGVLSSKSSAVPSTRTSAGGEGGPTKNKNKKWDKKYKWDITYADKYMWASSGGGQMHVDYGGKLPLPPSAPQEHARKQQQQQQQDIGDSPLYLKKNAESNNGWWCYGAITSIVHWLCPCYYLGGGSGRQHKPQKQGV